MENVYVKKWIKEKGEKFLKEIGIEKGQTVLDFGCNEGHYAIPAAKVVGSEGKVYAIDKNETVLNKLKEIAELERLKNIETIISEEKLKIFETSNCFVDVVLLYDIIHLVSDRNKLYREMYRILKSNGLLSVYPKHYIADEAGWGLEDMSLDDIIKEIEKTDFNFEKEFFKKLIHDDHSDTGYILNFRKL